MNSKLPFVVDYTKEMSNKFNKELMESKTCPMTNPKFYGNWDLVDFDSPEYNQKVKVKRNYDTEKN